MLTLRRVFWVGTAILVGCAFGPAPTFTDEDDLLPGRGRPGQDGGAEASTSTIPSAPPSCADGIKNGNEIETDCGGDCAACPPPFSATGATTLPGGHHAYSTFTVDPGAVVTVTGNEPLVVEVNGPVTIHGALRADGTDSKLYLPDGGVAGAIGLGVAGGTNGGDCGVKTGGKGGGPGGGAGGTASTTGGWGTGGGGGGHATPGAAGGTRPNDSAGAAGGAAGAAYGDPKLELPDGGPLLLGGSGGGGGGSYAYCNSVGTFANTSSSAGGGGGGAIMIVSKTSITIGAAGVVSARGGNSAPSTYPAGTGGGGSGGTIWLRAPTLAIDGSVTAMGGVAGTPGNVNAPPPGQTSGTLVAGGRGGDGAPGRIRLDAQTRTGSGPVTPAPGHSGTYP